jgi:myo-inositol-1-phosphate synthase
MNHGVAGQLDGPSSYLMKSPHNQRPDDEAREATEEFIEKHGRLTKATKAARDAKKQPAEEKASA